jgi:hypothetical protein
MADAAKPVRARRLERFEHRLDPVAELQIRTPDDARRRPARAIEAAGAGGSQPLAFPP